MEEATSPRKQADERVLATLRSTFGFAELWPLQDRIIGSVLRGQDVFALMPTGGGKSLCYQLPAILQPGITVVVSPLIALMKDQVDRLQSLSIPATFINSSADPAETRERLAMIERGEIKLLYAAPERLMLPGFLDLLARMKIAFFAVDEAHCISEWGHDFRPEYRALHRLRQLFPATPIAAFTATATPRVQTDILANLQLRGAAVFKGSLNRPNLYYQVWPKHKAYEQVLGYLSTRREHSGIIYVQSRDGADNLAARLQADGFSAVSYHAGLGADERRASQESFIKGDVRIMVATIAFGMGIDKPDIRFVIHYDLPKNLEGYYQESGRAGRDGRNSDCILLYTYGDAVKRKHFITQKASPGERGVAWEQLDQMVQWAEGTTCRREALLAYFAERLAQPQGACCDICRPPHGDEIDYTILAQMLLSCAKRTGESFGITHLINVLRGSRAKRLLSYHHDTLTTYGIGRDISELEWQHLARELVRKGYLRKRPDRFDALQVTPLGEEVLFKGRIVNLPAMPGSSRTSVEATPRADRKQAREQGRAEASTPRSRQAAGDSMRETAAMFSRGMSPEEIAKERGLALSTVESHLAEAIEEGMALDLGRLLAEEKRAAIEAALRRFGPGPLKPAKEALGEGFSYSEIRLVRAAIGFSRPSGASPSPVG